MTLFSLMFISSNCLPNNRNDMMHKIAIGLKLVFFKGEHVLGQCTDYQCVILSSHSLVHILNLL